MKVFKRLAAIVLVIMLMSALMMPVSAVEETKTITINNADSGHTFEAYQIFKGDLSGAILSNLQWGNGVDSATLLINLKAETTIGSLFTTCASAEDVAAVLESDNWEDSYIDLFAKVVATSLVDEKKTTLTYTNPTYTATLPVGYYLIKDAANHAGTDHAYTKYIIHLVNNATINPKTATPTMTKQVSHYADKEFKEALSASVGDYVYFKLTATLTTRMNDYPEYYIQFVDKLPAGLEYVEVSSVKVSGNSIALDQYGFTKPAEAPARTDGIQTVTFTLPQVKKAILDKTHNEIVEGDTIEVVFKARVLSDIVVNATSGNIVNAHMLFSNNPNIPNPSGSLGKTSDQMAQVYAYGIAIDKVDAADPEKHLSGAKFKIYRKNSVGEDEYVQANEAGVVTGWTTTEGNATEFTTNASSEFTVKGLGMNTYYLKETQAPASYNSLKSIPSISFVATFDPSTNRVSTFTGTVVGHGSADLKSISKDTGIATVTVRNAIGAKLPETGGMGTTVFYLGGLVLVAGAAVLLISRKRKGAEG